jgi:DNA-binding response OmpR family regulator
MHRILLIEDDDNVRKMLRRTLVAAGYDVQDAANGALGIEYYLHQRSDVVITDIVRPDREGLETIRELRRLHAGVKIIAMSGGGRGSSQDYLKLAHQFGALRTLSKPFSGDEILTVVAEVLAAAP